MCGRIVQDIDPVVLESDLGVKILNDIQKFTRYNLPPTTRICIIREEGSEQREARMMRWGLIPSWVKNLSDFKATTFNSRSDRIMESKVFRPAFEKRRCLIPVEGYYEWKTVNKSKQPYFIKPKHGNIFCLAGIWDRTTLATGEIIESCSIITCEASVATEAIHDRMPVILAYKDQDRWIHNTTPVIELLAMLQPFEDVEFYPVDKAVGNVRNDSASLIEPAF